MTLSTRRFEVIGVPKKVTTLCWGTVDQSAPKRRIDRQFVQIRLNKIARYGLVERVDIETSHHTISFYQNFDFKLN